MKYLIIPVTPFIQNCTLLWCEKTKLAVLIDPGGDIEKIKAVIQKTGITLINILLTHGHIDHVGAAAELAQYYHVLVWGPESADKFWLQNLPIQSNKFGFNQCQPLIPDRWLIENDYLNIGCITLKVLHCPGHTPGHIVFFDKKSRLLISGDTLFKNSIGRSDFPQSNYSKLIQSINKKLLPLGDDVTFIPGHGPISIIGDEIRYNPFLKNTK